MTFTRYEDLGEDLQRLGQLSQDMNYRLLLLQFSMYQLISVLVSCKLEITSCTPWAQGSATLRVVGKRPESLICCPNEFLSSRIYLHLFSRHTIAFALRNCPNEIYFCPTSVLRPPNPRPPTEMLYSIYNVYSFVACYCKLDNKV